jgi:hypothetical protein
VIGVLGVLVTVFSGCTPRVPDTNRPPLVELPAWSEVADVHNARVAKLQYLAARGTVSLKWRDEAGDRHNEPQVELALWIHLPRSTALSMEKLGERYFWIGSDEVEFWLFDLSKQPTKLVVGRHGDFVASETPLGLHPLTVVELLGFSPMPEEPRPVRAGADGRTIVVETMGHSGRVDLHLQASSLLPVRAEAFDANGNLAMTCEMRDYKSAFLPGRNVLEHPKVPGVFDIRDTAGDVDVRVQLEDATCATEGQPYPRVFDLKQLTEHLAPDETERLNPSAALPRSQGTGSVSSGHGSR